MIITKPQTTISINPYDGFDPDPEQVLLYLLIAVDNAYADGEYKETIKTVLSSCLEKLSAIDSEFLV